MNRQTTKIRQDKSTCISYCRKHPETKNTSAMKPFPVIGLKCHYSSLCYWIYALMVTLIDISLTVCEARDSFCLPSEPIYARVHFIVCCIDSVWTLFFDKEAQWAGCRCLQAEMAGKSQSGNERNSNLWASKWQNMSVSCPIGRFKSLFKCMSMKRTYWCEIKSLRQTAITFVKLH